MQAAAYLPRRYARSNLERAIPAGCRLSFATSWAGLDQLIRRLPVEVAVIDPSRADGVEVAPVERLRTYYSSLSILLYMPFSPEAAEALLRLGGAGVRGALFFEDEDSAPALIRALEEALTDSLSERLLQRILREIGSEPRSIVHAFRAALRNVDEIRTAQEWSQYLGTPHRSFYRIFRSHGLPTPKTCLMWLRLMYAARLLQDPGFNLHDVVDRLGYNARSNFWHHTQDVLGVKASKLRHAIDFETLLQRFISEHVRPESRRRSTEGA